MHVRAAKLSIGDTKPHAKKLRKARKKRASKKGPEDLTIVEAADDSAVLSRALTRGTKRESTSLLVSTKVGNVKRKRFSLPINTLSEEEDDPEELDEDPDYKKHAIHISPYAN